MLSTFWPGLNELAMSPVRRTQFVAFHAEEAGLILQCSREHFIMSYINAIRYPVSINRVPARVSQHRVEQGGLVVRVLGWTAI